MPSSRARADPRGRAPRARWRSSAGAHRPVRRSAVREHERDRDALARDAAPALGEMPEERQQPPVDAVELEMAWVTASRWARSDRRSTITALISGKRLSATVVRRSINPRRTTDSAFQRIVTASNSGGPSMCQGRTMSPGPSSSAPTVSPSTTSRASTPSAISSPRCSGSASASRPPSHSPTGRWRPAPAVRAERPRGARRSAGSEFRIEVEH